MLRQLSLTTFTALFNAVSLLVFSPVYIFLGGVEIMASVGLFLAATVLCQCLDGGLALTVTRALSRHATNAVFTVIELRFLKVITLFSLFLILPTAIFFITPESGGISPGTLVAAVIVHQVFYFYSQAFLGISAYKEYAACSLLYNCGRHVFLATALYLNSVDFDNALLSTICILFIFVVFFRLAIRRRLALSNVSRVEINQRELEDNSYARGIFFGAIAASILASIDRLIATNFFDANLAGAYVTSFIFASVIALIPQPIYRVFFTRFSSYESLNDIALRRDLFFSSLLVTSLSALVGLLLIAKTQFLGELWLGEFSGVQVELGRLLAVLFTLVAIGWMPASVLQAHGLQHFQTIAIFVAISLGLIFTSFYFDEENPKLLLFVWFFHAILQSTFVPLVLMFKVSFSQALEFANALWLCPAAVLLCYAHLVSGQYENYLSVSFLAGGLVCLWGLGCAFYYLKTSEEVS